MLVIWLVHLILVIGAKLTALEIFVGAGNNN